MMVDRSNNNIKLFFVCDRLACKSCTPDCCHTSNITHAVNFHRISRPLLSIETNGKK